MHTTRFKPQSELNDEQASILAEALVDVALSSSAIRENNKYNAPWVIEWITQDALEIDNVISRILLQIAAYNLPIENVEKNHITIENTPNINWLEKTYKDFPPFSIGPFFIYGKHYKKNLPEEQIALQIDAATAFGSGEHETTKGCLQALLDLKGKGACPWNILDMGTGSGILAIAAWKLWKSPILAVDNDSESIIVTERHAKINGVALGKTSLLTECGDGFNAPLVEKQKPYELILANILAAPVIEMSSDLVRVLDDNGYAVLSGMLNEQSDLVASAYEGEGLKLIKRYDIGEWTTLIMQKP